MYFIILPYWKSLSLSCCCNRVIKHFKFDWFFSWQFCYTLCILIAYFGNFWCISVSLEHPLITFQYMSKTSQWFSLDFTKLMQYIVCSWFNDFRIINTDVAESILGFICLNISQKSYFRPPSVWRSHDSTPDICWRFVKRLVPKNK